jgi:hypothetical protein
LHPIQWYSMPALQGKDLWLVTTTGGPEASYHPRGYNRYFFDAFLPPYEQSAAVCCMRFLPPMVLHGAHSVDSDVVARHVEAFRQRLQSYPAWPELDDLEQAPPAWCPCATGPPNRWRHDRTHACMAYQQLYLFVRCRGGSAGGQKTRPWRHHWVPGCGYWHRPLGLGAWGWSPTCRTFFTLRNSAWC